jgi:hypothetical protein
MSTVIFICCEVQYPRSAIVPVTLQSAARDVLHPTYKGTVLFRNTFDGKLPATDYPKVNVCLSNVFLLVVMYFSFPVLLRDAPCLRSIGGHLGLALLQACTRAPTHPGTSSSTHIHTADVLPSY